MSHYRILKQLKKDENGVITTVAMIDSNHETVEFKDDEYEKAVQFVEIMNANTQYDLIYFVEKVN